MTHCMHAWNENISKVVVVVFLKWHGLENIMIMRIKISNIFASASYRRSSSIRTQSSEKRRIFKEIILKLIKFKLPRRRRRSSSVTTTVSI